MGGFISGIRCLFSNRNSLKSDILDDGNSETQIELIDTLYMDPCTTLKDRKEICFRILKKGTAKFSFLFSGGNESVIRVLTPEEYKDNIDSLFKGNYQFLADLLEESLTYTDEDGPLIDKKNATIMHRNLTPFLDIQGDNMSVDTIVQLQRVLFELDKIKGISGGSRKRRKPRKRSQTRLIRR